MIFTNPHLRDQASLSAQVFEYYNNKKDDRNLLQAEQDGLIHHHFGLGPTDPALDLTDQVAVRAEIQRQENVLTEELMAFMQLDAHSEQTLLDAGCGRGGTMLYLLRQLPRLRLHGINLTEYQTRFVAQLLEKEGYTDRAWVAQANYLAQPYPDATFDQIYFSETTQYAIDLLPLFTECVRTLKPKGYLNILTWCYNPHKPEDELRTIIEPINDHYASNMHPYLRYYQALEQAGLELTHTRDVSERLIPYWELREQWELKSGIEESFLRGHREGHLQYLFIRARLK